MARPAQSGLTENELAIMRLLWEKSPLSIGATGGASSYQRRCAAGTASLSGRSARSSAAHHAGAPSFRRWP